MLFNRENAHVTFKLIGVLKRISISLEDPSLSSEEYKKQLGQKIVTIKWLVEQQINRLENAETDRKYVISRLQNDLKRRRHLKTIDETCLRARSVIATMGDELGPLLLAYGRVAEHEEFAQLINAGTVETRWITNYIMDGIDKCTCFGEWKFTRENLFLIWMIDNPYQPFCCNPLSYALWKSIDNM